MASRLMSVESAIARCVSRRREIQAAYLFGSAATGRVRMGSDIDVAVLLAGAPDPRQSTTYRLELMSDLGAALHRTDVDIVVLNNASPLMAHRILSKGHLVFERSKSARVRFQVRTAGLYSDLVPMFETQIRYLKKHAREGRIRG